MRTYLAECALLAGNLCLDQRRVPDAAAQYATASQLIHEDGYLRRLAELLLLRARVMHTQCDAGAGEALREAEARIREPGRRPLDLLRGSLLRYENPTAPVAADEWDAAK